MIILLPLVAQAHSKELLTSHTARAQDSMDKFIDKVVDKLVDRDLTKWFLHGRNLDNMTLGRHGHLQLSGTQLPKHTQFLPCRRTSERRRPAAQRLRPASSVFAVPLRVTLNRAYATGMSAASALPKTWSNRDGNVLSEVVPGVVWAAERPFLWNNIDVGGKMAVVKLSDGSLWVHSPVELNVDLRNSLASIGPIAHIVSPNYEHVKYAKEWKDAYPDATLYGCPGLIEKEKGIAYDVEIGQDNKAPAAWGGDIEVCWFDCEKNPFMGGPFFNEVVFLHAPSRTLIVTDIYWNYPADNVPSGTWLWKQGMDKVYLPFYRNFMIDSRSKFETAMARVEAWEFDKVLPCHGDIVTSEAKRALLEFLQGL